MSQTSFFHCIYVYFRTKVALVADNCETRYTCKFEIKGATQIFGTKVIVCFGLAYLGKENDC